MAQRVQPNEPTRITQLAPAAGPVNRFARPELPPATVGESKTAQLAQALQGIQPAITGLLVHQQERQDVEAEQAGRAARAQAAVNFKEAVKKGLPLDKNPFFQKAWKEQDGSVTADQYMSDLTTALTVGDFAASKDNLESDKLFATFRMNWMEKNGVNKEDPVFVEAFNRKANQYDTNARGHQANLVGDRQINDMMNDSYHKVIGIYDDARANQLPASKVAEGMNNVADGLVALGVEPKKVNSILLDAARTEARETGTLEPFDALDSVRTGSGFLGRTGEAVAMRQEMEREIASTKWQNDEHAHTMEIRKREQQETDLSAEVFSTTFKNQIAGKATTYESLSPQILELAKLDPLKAHSMQEIIDSANKPRPEFDDQPTRHDLFNKLFTSSLRQPDINTQFMAHRITVETADKLTSELKSQLTYNQGQSDRNRRLLDEQDISKVPAIVAAEQQIKAHFSNEQGNIFGEEQSARALEAIFQFRAGMWEHRNSHHDEDPKEFLKVIGGYAKDIMDLYPQVGGPDDGPKSRSKITNTLGGQLFGQVEKPNLTFTQATQPPPAGTNVPSKAIPEFSLTPWFENKLKWQVAFDEFTKNPDKLEETSIGRMMIQQGISDPAQIDQLILEQNTLWKQ